jgi:hypothetical protein
MRRIAQGKIAKVLNDAQIAITCGTDMQVEIGDQVRVMDNVEITDPDTGEYLGSILVQVIILRVNFVMAKAATAMVVQRASGSYSSLMSPIFSQNPLLKLTSDVIEVDSRHVLVTVGQTVIVERREDSSKLDLDSEKDH